MRSYGYELVGGNSGCKSIGKKSGCKVIVKDSGCKFMATKKYIVTNSWLQTCDYIFTVTNSRYKHKLKNLWLQIFLLLQTHGYKLIVKILW